MRDQEDEEEKVQWRVDAEVRLRTGALQAQAAQQAAQQGSHHSQLQACSQLCFRSCMDTWQALRPLQELHAACGLARVGVLLLPAPGRLALLGAGKLWHHVSLLCQA